ncbi:hypothetical protein BY458DRAFT_591277 [Sporodiniella umbellata]|nr:hypothetical protein BY458DRAFT_591277 [Sporodiniella umbellata]
MVCFISLTIRRTPEQEIKGILFGDEEGDARYSLSLMSGGNPRNLFVPDQTPQDQGKLDSFLIKILFGILKFKGTDGKALIEKTREITGASKRTGIDSLDRGILVTLVGKSDFFKYHFDCGPARFSWAELRTPTKTTLGLRIYCSIFSFKKPWQMLKRYRCWISSLGHFYIDSFHYFVTIFIIKFFQPTYFKLNKIISVSILIRSWVHLVRTNWT